MPHFVVMGHIYDCWDFPVIYTYFFPCHVKTIFIQRNPVSRVCACIEFVLENYNLAESFDVVFEI